MAEVDFPSPSIFLQDIHHRAQPPTPVAKSSSRTCQPKKNAVGKRQHEKTSLGKGKADASKPKQTKSRDGCITCKEKRLKCDETHPTCQQCQRRKVQCGGYKKTFTFRPVEHKFARPANPASSTSKKTHICNPSNDHFVISLGRPSASKDQFEAADAPPSLSFSKTPSGTSSPDPPDQTFKLVSSPQPVDCGPPYPDISAHDPFPDIFSAPPEEDFGHLSIHDQLDICRDPSDTSLLAASFRFAKNRGPGPAVRLSDIQDKASGQDELSVLQGSFADIGHDVHEIERNASSHQSVGWCYPSPSSSASSTSSDDWALAPSNQIRLSIELTGVLHDLFHTRTCGILSIKNGPQENPWRTALWPMTTCEPALHYALLSMTASHVTAQYPELRMKALEFQTTSIELLRNNIASMRSDAALATALVLAFSESWHSHINTGIHHLRGARELIMTGLADQEQMIMNAEELARIRFLRSTWLYMDVIARLTAALGEDPDGLDLMLAPAIGPQQPLHEIDPLMGCAATLFPLIGAVANLVKKIRKTSRTPLREVAKAASLRDQIQNWQVPANFIAPKDETLEIDHSRQTAEAYRYATLLFLFQAVPMICIEEPAALAERALSHLAAVPVTSPATIIHIFPLLAAGCEASSAEDREFVRERWDAMKDRMCIGNLDRCCDVMREVWSRRDAAGASTSFAAPKNPSDLLTDDVCIPGCIDPWLVNNAPSASHLPSPGRDEIGRPRVKIEPEMTVRGNLHWVVVMRDLEWESRFFFHPMDICSCSSEHFLITFANICGQSFSDDPATFAHNRIEL